MRKLPLILAASLALAAPAAVVAQDTTVDNAAMTTGTPVQEDDDDFPWGLLGLLGLAGLLGRKRNDTHVHTDRR